MNEKIAVIGSNSFSGSNFVSFTLEKGADLIGISRSPEPDPVFLSYKTKKNPAFRFYQLDLNNNLARIMEVIRSFQPAYVVNFAAQGMVSESWQYPEHWFQTNTVANIKLHNKLRKCEFLKKYIHISTPEVYGNCQSLIKENTSYNPSTPYAVSKCAADMNLMNLYKIYHFPVVFTRSANVYGPRQQLYRIIPRTIFCFLIGKKLQLHGGGRSVRSFIHIRDVADGTLKAARAASNGEIFHFSTSENISISTLVQMIATKMNVSFEKNVEIVKDRLAKDTAYFLDSSKARKELKWKDSIVLEEGLRETIAWVKNNLEVLKKQPFNYVHKA